MTGGERTVTRRSITERFEIEPPVRVPRPYGMAGYYDVALADRTTAASSAVSWSFHAYLVAPSGQRQANGRLDWRPIDDAATNDVIAVVNHLTT